MEKVEGKRAVYRAQGADMVVFTVNGERVRVRVVGGHMEVRSDYLLTIQPRSANEVFITADE